jgi:hypothetical protein
MGDAMNWILIIFMTSPGGDFVGKDIMYFESKKFCDAVRVQLPVLNSPMGLKHKGICVTRDHWEGKKQMPGVAYD